MNIQLNLSNVSNPPINRGKSAPEEHLCECGTVYPGRYHAWGCPSCRKALGSNGAEYEILGFLTDHPGGATVQVLAANTGFDERHCQRVCRKLVMAERITKIMGDNGQARITTTYHLRTNGYE